MSRFFYIRHGETDWNKQKRMQGSRDIPLNETGLAQAALAAERLKDIPITKIVSSPLSRARVTAETIGAAFSLPVELEPELQERVLNDYEGIVFTTERRIPHDPDDPHGPADYPDGNVELFVDLRDRAMRSVERWTSRYPDDLILFVAHGGLFSALHYGLGCRPYMKIENATPYEFTLAEEGSWVCRLFA